MWPQIFEVSKFIILKVIRVSCDSPFINHKIIDKGTISKKNQIMILLQMFFQELSEKACLLKLLKHRL